MTEQTAFDLVLDTAMAYTVARCLHVIADLAVADALGNEPVGVDEVAARVGADSDALMRALRLLSSYGIFTLDGGRLAHTPASHLLRSDHPQSMRALVRFTGSSNGWRVWEELEYSIKSGKPAQEKVYQGSYWESGLADAESIAVFNEAMMQRSRAMIAGIVQSFEFAGYERICDVGGGKGHLLAAVLDVAPEARGVLFELPHMIQDATALVSERITLVAGDVFADALPACDLYLIKDVIHDWPDAEALQILRAIRRSAPSRATLLVQETIIPDGNEPHFSKSMDVSMLVLLGARQRTEAELASLLDKSGFALEHTIDTMAGISILEARVV